MDGYKFNKLAGAIILAVLIIMGIKEVNNVFNEPDAPEQTAYEIEGVEQVDAAPADVAEAAQDTVEDAAEEVVAAAEAGTDAAGDSVEAAADATAAEVAEVTDAAPAGADPNSLSARLAAGDAEKGAKVFRKCTQCHTMTPDGRKRQGPDLDNIVGAAIGGKEGYKYSKNMAAHGGTWTYEALDVWLEKPSNFIKRTKMSLALKKPEDRANVIAYMRSYMDNPPPLPTE